MVQTIFEADPHNPIYNEEFTEDLIAIENLLKSFSEKFNVLLTYNSEKFPQELSCVINSDFVKIPSHSDRDKHIDLSLHFNSK